jgi:cytochrome c oxidase assembly protein subunit 15
MPALALTRSASRAADDERPIALWLIACCAVVFVLVLVGGITRLTESGLSITEWQPLSGVLPPLNKAQWADAFERYQAIPQYRAIHPDMTLAAFKAIYFWEYVHRLLGRLVGAAFALPFAYFVLRRRISRRLAPKLAGLFVLGALQGAIGWYMVASGLEGRIEVSQYRLALHLGTAVVIYGAMLWVALDLLAAGKARAPAALVHGASAVLGLAFLTMIAGAFVAGLRAGYVYNTFPLMNGHWVVPDYWRLAPWYANWFENVGAVQFDHRVLALTTVAATLALWLGGWRAALAPGQRLALHVLLALAAVQASLGVATLLLVVPLPLAVLHQAGALALVTAALVARHGLGAPASL